MTGRGRTLGRSARRAGAMLICSAILGAGTVRATRADNGATPRRVGTPVATVPAAVSDTTPVAAVRYDGTPAPGSRLVVQPEGTPSPNATYHWSQVEGPAVAVENWDTPRLELTVPAGARSLGFVLTIRDARGQRSSRASIPILPAAAPARGLQADAGDDQIGLVGRRITLNGSRSTPRSGIAYRWLTLSGPKVEEPTQDGYYYTFTPKTAGTYRFGLVVASIDAGKVMISDVDEVVVTVGELPSSFGPGVPSGVPTAAIDQILHGPGAAAGRVTLEQTAEVFDAIAARASLYTTFAEASSETMRRLDAIIPAEPGWRQYWSQGVFAPMTQHLVSEMLALGLDLRGPQGLQQGLSPSQQDRLGKLFSSYAREFRSRAQDRPAQ